MVRSSHHLPLPSLPPPRVVLCSPFSPCPPPPPPAPPAGKFEGELELRRRGIAASHLSRGPAESLPICKRVADGHHHHHHRHHRCVVAPSQPFLFPHARCISTISEDGYLACRPHFFGPPYRLTVLLFPSSWRILSARNPR